MRLINLMIACFVFLVGCTSFEPNSTQRAAAVYGYKIENNEAKKMVVNYLENTLMVNPKFTMNCTDLTDKAWVRRSKEEDYKFGYLMIAFVFFDTKGYCSPGYCDGNVYVFLFNGDKFEYQKGVEKGFEQFGVMERSKPKSTPSFSCGRY